MGPCGSAAAELERDYRCLINVREEGPDGLVPVEVPFPFRPTPYPPPGRGQGPR